MEVGQPLKVPEAVEERREDCGHYQACLLYAINKDWTNFSCEECSDFMVSTVELRLAAEDISASFTNARRV